MIVSEIRILSTLSISLIQRSRPKVGVSKDGRKRDRGPRLLALMRCGIEDQLRGGFQQRIPPFALADVADRPFSSSAHTGQAVDEPCQIRLFGKLKLVICAPISGPTRGRFFHVQVAVIKTDLPPGTPRRLHG
jgi:hypothetical protein